MTNIEADSRFWYGIAKTASHDMGTPLSSIMGWLQLIPSMPDSQIPFDEIFYSVERMTTISNRLELLAPPTRKQKVDLFPIAEAIVIYFEKRIGKDQNRIKFHVAMAPDDNLMGQPELIHWAIEHLVKNAVDALVDMKGEIRLEYTQDERDSLVRVLDSGIGITDIDPQKLFEPGYTTKKKGRGIGLPLVKHIVETLHQGAVQIQKADPPFNTLVELRIPQSQL
ncbi:HAMP domain-containing histidine kinase [bacterium]|nr:HAMP domain-containing histidine kinase [bacterium]MBU1651412.1 HAMP domain-containing histidine kinase [bacterium]